MRLLADALGLTAGERTQLDAAARGEPVPPAHLTGAPRQLPANIAGFAGRAQHLSALDAMLAGGGMPAAVVVSAIVGPGGAGKTALAVHWAHRVADRFPDGQLYVNLRGHAPGRTPVDPAVAVRRLLGDLGVAPARVPVDLDAQAALYRSCLAGRRMLVLLDNASDAEQVRPLLPGTPGCFAVVTSRNRLTGLVAAEGAQPLTLDLLSTVEAWDLLACRLGSHRVAAEPQSVDHIVTLCARLPLALAVAAARAATCPGMTLAALAAELRDARSRLDAFETRDAATDVRAVLSCSYERLSTGAARLFRLLGAHPDPGVSASAAASLAGLAPRQVRSLLTELTDAHLLIEHTSGRYTFHDLLRAYAAEQARTLDPDDQRYAATHRVLDHYLHTAYTADRLLYPPGCRSHLPHPCREPSPKLPRIAGRPWPGSPSSIPSCSPPSTSPLQAGGTGTPGSWPGPW